VETNEKFGMDVMELFRNYGLKDVNIIRDIHGKDRIVRAKRM
jgi:methylase of polypeptide subunit release factors